MLLQKHDWEVMTYNFEHTFVLIVYQFKMVNSFLIAHK